MNCIVAINWDKMDMDRKFQIPRVTFPKTFVKVGCRIQNKIFSNATKFVKVGFSYLIHNNTPPPRLKKNSYNQLAYSSMLVVLRVAVSIYVY